MKQYRLIRLTAVMTTVLTITALAASSPSLQASERVSANSDQDQAIRQMMNKLTLPEKVGQMFIARFSGDTTTTNNPPDVAINHKLYGSDMDNASQLVTKYHLGEIFYTHSDNNTNDPAQIVKLSNGLQQASLADTHIPLLITADQEGGTVNHIAAPAAVSPGNMAIGATFNPSSAYRAAFIYGSEQRSMGIDLDIAPVVDVNTNPSNQADGPRSFGDRTPAVADFAAAEVAGYQATGIGDQAKHFPGLGSTEANTDDGIGVTNETRGQISSTDLPPFQAAIAAGVKSIMVSHLVIPSLDHSGLPASLSHPIVTDLLRNQLHYQGVIGTDSLKAKALAKIPPKEVILDAINAGEDELYTPLNLGEAIQTVLDAVHNGELSQSRIDQSVYRLLRMKFELGLFGKPYASTAHLQSEVGTPSHLQTMAEIAQQSITLLRNDAHLLPLNSGSGKHVLVTGWGATTTQNLATDLSQRGVSTQRIWTDSPAQPAIDAAVTAAQGSDLTLVTTYNAWADPTQQALVKALLATGRPVIIAAVGGPYDIAYFPTAPTYLATYGYQPNSMAALTDTLFGAKPTGRLPVTIPAVARGDVLFQYGAGGG
ncbi:MAG: glycoside hydrolase family 3 protein [Candidatus Dormibacteraceae bacterium]